MLYNICYITRNWRLYKQTRFCYVARCLLYNKKLSYIAHPNLPYVTGKSLWWQATNRQIRVTVHVSYNFWVTFKLQVAPIQLSLSEPVNPSTIPIQNVKQRVKQSAALYMFYLLSLYKNAGNPGNYQHLF